MSEWFMRRKQSPHSITQPYLVAGVVRRVLHHFDVRHGAPLKLKPPFGLQGKGPNPANAQTLLLARSRHFSGVQGYCCSVAAPKLQVLQSSASFPFMS